MCLVLHLQNQFKYIYFFYLKISLYVIELGILIKRKFHIPLSTTKQTDIFCSHAWLLQTFASSFISYVACVAIALHEKYMYENQSNKVLKICANDVLLTGKVK